MKACRAVCWQRLAGVEVAGACHCFEAGLDSELADDIVEMALDGANRHH